MIDDVPLLIPATVGASAGVGILLVIAAVRARRPTLAARLAQGRVEARPRGGFGLVANARVAHFLDALGSTAESVTRRLVLAGKAVDVAAFRLRQVIVGIVCAGLAATSAVPFIVARGVHGGFFAALLTLIGLVAGMSLWDRALTWSAASRQVRIEQQVPDASELLALAVGAGESIPAALERVARISPDSDLAVEIDRTITDIRLGTAVTRALSDLAERNDSPALVRLCHTLITAIERGSPLAQILHDQARDIREAARRRLMEEGGKREIAMLVPVVFLILPVTVLFALYPGLMALDLY